MIRNSWTQRAGIAQLAGALLLLSTLNACGDPAAPASEPIRPAEEIGVIHVRDFGVIKLRFFPKIAPNHVSAFKKLSRQGFYDGVTFHRVLPGMFAQAGDPNTKDDDPGNDGFGGPGYFLRAEFSDTPHRRGILSMARKEGVDTAGSQFFIMVADHEDWKELFDGQFTVFGEVIEGIEVAVRISQVERDRKTNRPHTNVVMESVRIEGPNH